MKCYLCLFNNAAIGDAARRDALHKYIDSRPEIKNWMRVWGQLPNSYIVYSELSAKELTDVLLEFTGRTNEPAMIVTPTDGASGWLTQSVWDFLSMKK